jgi:hypothetical protein
VQQAARPAQQEVRRAEQRVQPAVRPAERSEQLVMRRVEQPAQQEVRRAEQRVQPAVRPAERSEQPVTRRVVSQVVLHGAALVVQVLVRETHLLLLRLPRMKSAREWRAYLRGSSR